MCQNKFVDIETPANQHVNLYIYLLITNDWHGRLFLI